jgi:hypothetical protein
VAGEASVLPDDYIGSIWGLLSRFRYTMAGLLFVTVVLGINLKLHAGMEISTAMIQIAFAIDLLLAIAGAIFWHSRSGQDDS